MDKKDNKKKKISGIVVNTIVIVILVFVGLITLSIILSAGKGYTNLFGNAYVAVQSDSMEGTDELYSGDYSGYTVKGFKKGDLIRVRVLNDDEKAQLKTGDVITFYDDSLDGRLNTHRIVASVLGPDGVTVTSYITQGDKAKAESHGTDNIPVTVGKIVGVYEGHRLAGVGNVSLFFHSSAGFFVCVVVPSLLIVAYFAFNLFITVKSVKASYAEAGKQDEEAQMREKIMQELREQGKIVDETPTEDPKPEEKPEDTTNGEA